MEIISHYFFPVLFFFMSIIFAFFAEKSFHHYALFLKLSCVSCFNAFFFAFLIFIGDHL